MKRQHKIPTHTKILHVPSWTPLAQCLSNSTCCNTHLYYDSGYYIECVEQQHSVLPGAAGCTWEAFAQLFDRATLGGPPLHPTKSDRACGKGGTDSKRNKGILAMSFHCCTLLCQNSKFSYVDMLVATCGAQQHKNFQPFHHIRSDAYFTCLDKAQSDPRTHHRKIGAHRQKSLSELMLSLGWFRTPFEGSRQNTLQKRTGYFLTPKYFPKNGRPDSQVTSEKYIRFDNRNLLAMVQATWILILPALVRFYASLDLSGSGTVRYTGNVAKEKEVFFKGFILASLRISTPHHKG